jgi:hypothetical protein
MMSLACSSGRQRALAMLAAAGGNGLTQQFLAGCDLGAGTVAALIEKGFASHAPRLSLSDDDQVKIVCARADTVDASIPALPAE